MLFNNSLSAWMQFSIIVMVRLLFGHSCVFIVDEVCFHLILICVEQEVEEGLKEGAELMFDFVISTVM